MGGWDLKLWAASSSLIAPSICFGWRPASSVKKLEATWLSPALPGTEKKKLAIVQLVNHA